MSRATEFAPSSSRSDITRINAELYPSPADDKDDEIPELYADHHGLSMLQAICLVATCTTAMILNIANTAAVSIALPTIGRELNIDENKLQWVISAFSLSSGCLLLFFGRIADLYGRKHTFLAGILVLGAFGLGCGFAQDEITLDVLRGFQGVGAAASMPSAIGILAAAFPPSRARSFAFATFGAGGPVGAAIGLLVGGTLTQLTSKTWRSIFYLLSGLSALCFVSGVISIDKDLPSTEKDRRIDWIGAFFVTIGLIMIIFVLSQGSIASHGWKTNYIIALIVIGIIFLMAFVIWEHYLEVHMDWELEKEESNKRVSFWTPPPLMRISVWSRASGKLGIMLLIACVDWASFMSFVFWLTLYYQNYLGLTPVLTMIRLIPMFTTGLCCTIIVAFVVNHIPVVYLIVTGTTLTGVANLLFAVIDPNASYWAFGFPAAILGVFGADFVFASGMLFVAKVCLPHEQSVGSALFQTLTQYETFEIGNGIVMLRKLEILTQTGSATFRSCIQHHPLQLGTALGLAVSTIVFNSELSRSSAALGVHVNGSGTNAPKSAQLAAYKDTMWVGFAFGTLGAVLAAVVLRGVGIVGHQAASARDMEHGGEGEKQSEYSSNLVPNE